MKDLNFEYHNVDTSKAFNSKQEVYDLFRPNYDEKLLDILKDEYGLNKESIIVDYGCGTGKFTTLISKIAKTCYAVEPNQDMINLLLKKTLPDNNIIFLNEKAEGTTIPNNIIDFAFSVHSFHYFNKEDFKKELQRVLKESGYFGIIWYDYLDSSSVFQTEWNDFMYANKGFKDNHNKKEDRDSIYIDGMFKEHVFNVKKEYSYIELLGLGLSVSSNPLPNEDGYFEFEKEVKSIFEKHNIDDKVTFNLKCYLQIGRV